MSFFDFQIEEIAMIKKYILDFGSCVIHPHIYIFINDVIRKQGIVRCGMIVFLESKDVSRSLIRFLRLLDKKSRW